MADDNEIKLVDTGAPKQLVEQDTGLVEEVRILRQHMADMYQAWMTGKAPPPPPPSFLDATLTQAPTILSDDPPYSPDFPTYHSFLNLPSSSIVRPPTTFPKNSPPVMSTIPTITNSQQPLLESNRKEGQDEISRKMKGIEQSLKNMQEIGNQTNMSYNNLCMFPDVHLPARFKIPKFNLYDGRGDPVVHLRGYCSEMRSVGGKDKLLMAYFSESLSGAALE
ncbi:uncharacterized protein [Nicotiana tomentosiformis]|uniref:uncharacterized protein n=1 Tax=Nicotiana tomentosiformis TaxID=4098 RepID=UPI00388C8D4E